MATRRSIETMYDIYDMYQHGEGRFGYCGDCCNYQSARYRGKTYRKCALYGATKSTSTDWVSRWAACGRFDIPCDESRIPLEKRLKAEELRNVADNARQTSMEEL